MTLIEGFKDGDDELRALTDAFAIGDDFDRGCWGRGVVHGDNELEALDICWRGKAYGEDEQRALDEVFDHDDDLDGRSRSVWGESSSR